MNYEKFIKRQSVAFIGSVSEDGFPYIKAMLKPRKMLGLKEIYFSTNTSSLRVNQYQKNEKASVYFYSKLPLKYEGLLLIGTMEIMKDRKVKESIWEKGDTMYYPKGIDDPDYCVLKFTSLSGRHYCNLKTEDINIC